MAKVNSNYTKLPGSYLFSEIARRVNDYAAQHPDREIIRLGIGDVTKPLTPTVIKALHTAVDEMSEASTFRGYGPEQGYDFLRQAIIRYDFAPRGVDLSEDEIFVSDGAKSDTGNIGDIFGVHNTVAVCDPSYTVYVDTNAMAGRAGIYSEQTGHWSDLIYMPCTKENHFVAEVPGAGDRVPDIIYLCYPNNPTGAAATREELKAWVDYALTHKSVILFDAAYEAYITEDLPHSIYEIDGAKFCAIEFRSFSKNAGFTGTRCAYTVIPKELTAQDDEGREISLNQLWNRRQTTKFNGVPYIIQRGAEAVYTPQGQAEIKGLVAFYQKNARIIKDGLSKMGFEVFGGVNSPYIWLKTPDHMTSWEFFDDLLHRAHVVGTPGSGFGPCGEGYFRLTGFGSTENTEKAIGRMKEIYEK